MIERIQHKLMTRGYRLPEGAKVVSRPSRWGNPYKVADYGAPQAVALYRQYLASMPPDKLEALLAPLRGATALACWCKPGEPCHADVLIEMLLAGQGQQGGAAVSWER